MNSAKAFTIPKVLIWDAYQDVKKSKGGPGADGQTMEEFEGNLKNNLYRIWNRMSSGSYIPPPVLWVEIPKPDGGIRQLGIPTISDRIAQAAVKRYLEPKVEPFFHDDSYGYRPGRSALDAVATARQRCWRSNWVLDLDISACFRPNIQKYSCQLDKIDARPYDGHSERVGGDSLLSCHV